MQRIPQTASLQQWLGLVTQAFYECLALLNLCAHLNVGFVKLGCGYFVMWCNFR